MEDISIIYRIIIIKAFIFIYPCYTIGNKIGEIIAYYLQFGNNLRECVHIIHNSGNNLGKVVPISFTILGITWEMCPYYSQFWE